MKNKEQLKEQKNLMGNSLLVFILFFLLISCNNKAENSGEVNSKRISDKGSIEFEFEFPDTIRVNKVYHGKIKYKGIFDTITTSFEDDKKSRYISYYMTKTKNRITDIKKFAEIKLDTFGAIDNRTIPFYDVKFTETGIFYLDGIINDHVTIDTLSNPKPDDKVRYLEKVVQATHRVIVVK